ncbi:hypothetical protein ACFV9P_29700 [Streptomyces sp. NPDC059892]|uniref:hypothetical protein n=1 Tax=unclassified Streptomyces TaxID=2593676 RepID=UPI0036393D37
MPEPQRLRLGVLIADIAGTEAHGESALQDAADEAVGLGADPVECSKASKMTR